MNYAAQTMGYLRYGLGLPAFLRRPLTRRQCRDLVRNQIRSREKNFLLQLERSVYSRPQSPYHKLLRNARIEFGDLENMIPHLGLTGTLERLSEAGVYIAVDEYKGRRPVERKGVSFHVGPEDFENPHAAPSMERISSSTRGRSIRTRMDFDFLTAGAAIHGVLYEVFNLYGVPSALWYDWLHRVIRAAKIGEPPERWFFPASGGRTKVASYYATATGKVLGQKLPWPELVGLNEAHRVAGWLGRTRNRTGRKVLWTTPSLAVRVSLAARELNLDISGSRIFAGGEPLSPARVSEIEGSGCHVTNDYGSSEMGGIVALGCPHSNSEDTHVFQHIVEVIRRARTVAATGVRVGALQFTSLLPCAPKILVNMETGDFGEVETRPCGCEFGALGLQRHLSHIRSFEKLTSEGMTFFAGDLAKIVEDVLPARFGGSPLDYQIIEEEAERGLGRLRLLVSPRVTEVDEDLMIRTVLRELRRGNWNNKVMADIWEEANTMTVARETPHPRGAGKVLPFQVR